MGYALFVVFVFVAATFTVASFFTIRRLKTCDYIIGMKYKVWGMGYAVFVEWAYGI